MLALLLNASCKRDYINTFVVNNTSDEDVVTIFVTHTRTDVSDTKIVWNYFFAKRKDFSYYDSYWEDLQVEQGVLGDTFFKIIPAHSSFTYVLPGKYDKSMIEQHIITVPSNTIPSPWAVTYPDLKINSYQGDSILVSEGLLE